MEIWKLDYVCWDHSATAEWTPRTNGERCLSINATKLIKRQNVDSSLVRRSLYWTSFYILYLLDIDGYTIVDSYWLFPRVLQ